MQQAAASLGLSPAPSQTASMQQHTAAAAAAGPAPEGPEGAQHGSGQHLGPPWGGCQLPSGWRRRLAGCCACCRGSWITRCRRSCRTCRRAGGPWGLQAALLLVASRAKCPGGCLLLCLLIWAAASSGLPCRPPCLGFINRAGRVRKPTVSQRSSPRCRTGACLLACLVVCHGSRAV